MALNCKGNHNFGSSWTPNLAVVKTAHKTTVLQCERWHFHLNSLISITEVWWSVIPKIQWVFTKIYFTNSSITFTLAFIYECCFPREKEELSGGVFKYMYLCSKWWIIEPAWFQLISCCCSHQPDVSEDSRNLISRNGTQVLLHILQHIK